MARIRQHGFSEREVKIAAAKLMADIESAYLERDQVYSTDVREEYVRNFLHGASSPLPPAEPPRSVDPPLHSAVRAPNQDTCHPQETLQDLDHASVLSSPTPGDQLLGLSDQAMS